MIDNVNGDIIIYQTDDGLTKMDDERLKENGAGSVSHNQAIKKA